MLPRCKASAVAPEHGGASARTGAWTVGRRALRALRPFTGPSTWALASSAAALPWQSCESSTSQVCRRMPLPVRQRSWMCGHVRGLDEQAGGKKKARTALCPVQCLFSAAAVASAFQCCCSEKESWRRLEVMHHQAEALRSGASCLDVLEKRSLVWMGRPPCCLYAFVTLCSYRATCKDLCSWP